MKIGVVGYGSIGSRHARNAVALGHETIIYDPLGPCDVRYERDVYEKADAVVIATPSWVHTGCIRACAERGKHMLVEKPISTSDNGMQELLDLAEKNGAVVMTGNNLRFHPCVKKTKEWLDAGLIGKPLWAQFTCAQASSKPLYLSDGVILNTGSHEVDLAMHLLGMAKVVMANAHLGFRVGNGDSAVNPMLRNCDDIADFMLLHDNGCRSTSHLDFVAPIPTREFRIVGDDGTLYCDLIKRCLYRWQPDPKLPDIVHFDNYASPTHSWDMDYLDEMRAFIDRIEGKDVPGATGADGLATLKVLLDVKKMAGL